MQPRNADPSDPIVDLSGALRHLAWTLRRSAPDRAGVPSVPTSELAVLKQVLETPGLTVTELAATLGMQRPNTSAVLRSLTLRGLVTREEDEGDRRRALIVPTSLAHSEATAIGDAWLDVIGEAVGILPADERAALLAAAPALRSLGNAIRAGASAL
ncbi:MarR family winged helix-turn-helix transcriptional regulator [Microbacterium allomyrinae]|uniref:Winged helix-turn-helix transcriptional regulator n=1 Tax=Microbacterium allomyrinae TaxID=2830666 RepID=A0A9X1LW80_9MICO|nr:MarR family winged helix-turn-helix transcriptional regulator [Microbacterium allomyrinae]MCC2033244.1 winged helix-turn-helix transcriptional regulator [Microbacterium allomyrinae]